MTPYLSLAIWVPIVAGIAVLVLGRDSDAGKARWTAGWRTNCWTGAKRPPIAGTGRRFVSSTGVRIWASAMGYTGMFMMSR